MSIPMANPWITEYERSIVLDMMKHGWDNYEYVEKFERIFAKWHGRKYALMTPCCTHAIHLVLLALGIKEGDEVIVPECTWTGSVAPVAYQNATPVFADINEDTWCLSRQTVEPKITPKTKAIIAVDLYGNMPDLTDLEDLAKTRGIHLIEDAAEALGSSFKGTRAGKFGIAGVHSFHRTKTLTTGEGGMLLIDDDNLYERAHLLRDHGRSKTIPYFIEEVAPKYMPSNLSAALGYAQFQRIDELVARKQSILHFYKDELARLSDITLNIENRDVVNGAWATTIAFGASYKLSQKKIEKTFGNLNLPYRPFFYPLSSLPAYKVFNNGGPEVNPVSYNVSKQAITLPSAYNISNQQMHDVCSGIVEIVQSKQDSET